MNFPDGFEPYDAQTTLLNKIERAIAKKKKFIICHAHTGSGKSFISKTLGNWSKEVPQSFINKVEDYSIYKDGYSEEERFGCFTLTITKALQDQYDETFKGTGILKGQSNYQCAIDDNVTVDIAPCNYIKTLRGDCWKKGICPYYNARNTMLTSKFSVLNYSMFFSLSENLRQRQVIVCDEGSELEDQLVSQFTCEIDLDFIKKCEIFAPAIPSEKTVKKLNDWVVSFSSLLDEKVEEYDEYLESAKKDSPTYLRKRQESTRLKNLQRSVDTLKATFYDCEYMFDIVDRVIKFIPLKVDVLSKHIFDCADHVIIMSATIIDPPNYCKNLGITDYEYIEVDSEFDPKKAPIYIMAKQKLNFNNMQSMIPKLMEQIEQILEHHKNDKGIIHTHTQFLADKIRNSVYSSRLLCREPGVRNEELLDIHFSSKEPTVLVSPSMTYGVDLKGDLAKFQIILKAPWLPTNEVRTSKLMKIDKDWYANSMLKTLIQACGRGIRSVDDECDTYILDGSIYDAIHRNKKKIPKCFLDRII